MKIKSKKIFKDSNNYWDITIPGNHNFVLDNGNVVHNCGTGVGYSVERQYVNKLPEIPDRLFQSDTTIIVKDSKEGWAKGLRQLIALLYSGEVPSWDLSKVRPAGAVLKTFGGRASGPEPLNDLFKFTVSLFKNATGRRLTSLECHDLMCKIASVIVSGGVRRSAMISLSNLSDDRMRHAKSGAWWEMYSHRALANNSAVYTEKPDVGMFMTEWLALYDSKSGERGIVNREALQKLAEKSGRRDPDWEFGTNPCSEIVLRPGQFCNLSEVVCRESDTKKDLIRKVKVAAILGTIQSTLTHFPYLRKHWKRNTEEERLLGVSLTGIYDNPLLNDYNDPKLPELLEELKQVAIDTNKEYAEYFGIPQSTSITCVKPSGSVSQLVDAASGIHPRYEPYYFRRVRGDNKDPLTQFLVDTGIPNEPDFMNPTATVFTFPKKAPTSAKVRGDISAIDHLELWLKFQRHWCEHKPSVTISVREEEWPEVGAWVWNHFDEMSGVSFLPHDGGSYRQAPYEEINEHTYNEWLEKIPTELDWDSLHEEIDNVEGAQTLACVAQSCDL
jgi:ribonucleoside-triphosphate reductase